MERMTPDFKMSDKDFNRFDPDAKLVKDSPCFCGRKSIARMRQYYDGKLFLFAVCEDHIAELKKIIEVLLK